ncbi:unnamed protein product, partial [Effrenium voratum]
GHAGVESITAALNEERRKNAQEGEAAWGQKQRDVPRAVPCALGQTPAVINPRFVKSSPDRKAFP